MIKTQHLTVNCSRKRPFFGPGPYPLEAGWSETPTQKLLSSRSAYSIKSFSTFSRGQTHKQTDRRTHRHLDRQTHRQTDTRPPIHIPMWKIFMPFLIPITWVCWIHSLLCFKHLFQSQCFLLWALIRTIPSKLFHFEILTIKTQVWKLYKHYWHE